MTTTPKRAARTRQFYDERRGIRPSYPADGRTDGVGVASRREEHIEHRSELGESGVLHLKAGPERAHESAAAMVSQHRAGEDQELASRAEAITNFRLALLARSQTVEEVLERERRELDLEV